MKDEKNTTGMFEWHNLPKGMSGNEIERALCYKGQLTGSDLGLYNKKKKPIKKVMISIHPEWMEKIIRREKRIEVRTTVPQDCPCEAYFYVTKGGKQLYYARKSGIHKLNGMVVAKFTLRKVEKIIALTNEHPHEYYAEGMDLGSILYKSRLSKEELRNYLKDKDGYAWHISDLVVFDEPMPLKDFGLKRAPQSWCYIKEVS